MESIIDFDQTIDGIASKLEVQLPLYEQALGQDSKPTELPEVFGRMKNRAHMIKKMHRRRKDALEQKSLSTTVAPMHYDFMMDSPFDLLFPFGEGPPMYGQYM